MPEEIAGIIPIIANRHEVELGGRTYHLGRINGCEVAVVFSHWGKVAAATTAATLIMHFGVNEIIFTGVAGAIDPGPGIGDLVIGRHFYQHDMDARPFIRRFEIPLLGLMHITSNEQSIARAEKAVRRLVQSGRISEILHSNGFSLTNKSKPDVYIGDIASGDRFISNFADRQMLKHLLPSVLCVEMEGAAVAQVCHEYDTPFTIFRIISDTADESAPVDFHRFIQNIAPAYAVEIVNAIMECNQNEVAVNNGQNASANGH